MSALSSNFSTWSTTLSANPESLTLPLSSTNVEHALRTAVARTPQKVLLGAILPHITLCLQNAVATSILRSLVRFATPKSVGQVCAALLPQWEHIRSSLGSSSEMATLLEAIVARSDDGSAARGDILKKLTALPLAETAAIPSMLGVLSALIVIDPVFASKLTKSKDALKAISAHLTGEKKCKESIRFVEQTLASVEDKPAMCRWVLQAMKASDPKARHRAEVVAAVACNADASVSDALSKNLVSWPQLVVKGEMAKALTQLLEKSSADTGAQLAAKIVQSVSVSEIVGDKGTVLAGLGIVLGQRFASLFQEGEAEKLTALKVRIDAATKPKNVSTKDIIMEKIRLFEASQKRPRSA